MGSSPRRIWTSGGERLTPPFSYLARRPLPGRAVPRGNERRHERREQPHGRRVPPARDDPSTEVILAIADAAGVEPTQLDPLATAVDPDGLDALFEDGKAPDEVMFRYQGYVVHVYEDGTIQVRPHGGVPATD
ncbi:HalOD1 output domain-containing protein [Halostella litorea]|uniref:HalOD1 output domain-containing protein n=1 Tax=Halostella litorea TaxID=2528831 RepID=UPI001386933A